MNIYNFSIEQLLRLSFQYGLITDYRISPSRVMLFRHEEEILTSDPEEARIFLQGLITGRSAADAREDCEALFRQAGHPNTQGSPGEEQVEA